MNDVSINEPGRSNAARSRHSANFAEVDYRAVDVMIELLKALDDETKSMKLREIEQSLPTESNIPIYLSQSLTDVWAKTAQWKRYEASLLLTGFVVTPVFRESFEMMLFSDRVKPSLKYFPVFQHFLQNHGLVSNSKLFTYPYERYYSDKVEALEIIKWAEKMELPLPSTLGERVKYFQTDDKIDVLLRPEVEEISDKSSDIINPKTKSTLLSLIYALAASKPFHYKPDDPRNGAVDRIETALIHSGLSLSKRTIRDYLKEANEEALKQREKNV